VSGICKLKPNNLFFYFFLKTSLFFSPGGRLLLTTLKYICHKASNVNTRLFCVLPFQLHFVDIPMRYTTANHLLCSGGSTGTRGRSVIGRYPRLGPKKNFTARPKNTHICKPAFACQKVLKLTYSNLEFQNFPGEDPRTHLFEGRRGRGKGREGGRGRIIARQCVHCCKGDAASQWERTISGCQNCVTPEPID